jgi:SSS family solute:Na+ symporter
MFQSHATPQSYLIIGVYLMFLLSIGIIFQRLNKGDSDFFRAGCRGSWWLVGMSIMMSGISTQTFIANAGVAYRSGFSIWWVYIVNAVCYVALFLGIAAWYRQARVTTFAEMVRERYGPAFQQFFTYYGILMIVVLGALGLFQLSLFMAAIFHFPVELVIVGVGVVVLFYSIIGGNWAILAADFLQGLVLFAMAVLLALLSLWAIGGVDGFLDSVRELGLENEFSMVTEDDPTGNYGFLWLVGVGVIQVYAVLGIMGGQRYFSCKDGTHARKAALFSAVMMLVGMVVFFLPPMVARLMFHTEIQLLDVPNPSDVAYAFMSMQLLPNGFVPLMAVAMFSAQMSTLDTALNANSAVFVKNGYPALMRLFRKVPNEDPRFQLALGRIFTGCLGFFLVAFALLVARANQVAGVFEIFIQMVGLVMVPMLLPLFLGIFVRQTPMWSGWLTFSVALATASLFFILRQAELYVVAPHVSVIITSVVGISAFLLSIPFFRYANSEETNTINTFFKRTRTPVDFLSEVGEGNDRQQMQLIGILASVLGVFISCFLLFPNSYVARFQILSVAAFVGSIGLFLLLLSKRKVTTQVSRIQESEYRIDCE